MNTEKLRVEELKTRLFSSHVLWNIVTVCVDMKHPVMNGN